MSDIHDSYPSCSLPFGSEQLKYPLHFDLRIIYTLACVDDFQKELERVLEKTQIPCSLIQGVAKPGAKYGRMGARVVIETKEKMDSLYSAVAAIPGVKAVI